MITVARAGLCSLQKRKLILSSTAHPRIESRIWKFTLNPLPDVFNAFSIGQLFDLKEVDALQGFAQRVYLKS